MYKSLLKTGFMDFSQMETRVIPANEMMEQRMAALAQKSKPGSGGFVAGLQAETIDLSEMELNMVGGAGEEQGMPVDPAAAERAREEAEGILADARAQAEKTLADAEAQAEGILADAKAQAEAERGQVLSQAESQGYAEGQQKAEREAGQLRQQLAEKERQLEAAYQQRMDELEPQFIDTLTGIYEHVFQVELQSHREILAYLISTTMRDIEESRSFLIHVSSEDYPYVSMQKKQIAAEAAAPGSYVEIVEDMALGKNECLIETEGGIFDCGVGTQLAELGQKLRLLSYEK